MPERKGQWGGRREGAGRKPRHPSGAGDWFRYWLPKPVAEAIEREARERGYESPSRLVAEILERSLRSRGRL